MIKQAFCLSIAVALCPVLRAASPYPDSTIVSAVSFSQEREHGEGADQWPLTVGSDGAVYALYGDGDGWQSGAKDYMGAVRITGTPGVDETGTNLWGDNHDDVNRKPLGIVGDTDNVLRMFYHHSGSRTVYTAESTDLGSSWSFDTTGVFDLNTDGAWVVGVAQYGAGYTGLPAHVSSTYYYVYLSDREYACGSHGAVGQDVYLARVPKTQIATRAAYDYYIGLDAQDNPIWSSDFDARQPVYSDPAGMQYHISVVWNPGLQRYILAQASPQGPDENWLGLFEGPHPWGPWNTIYYGEFYPGLNQKCLFTFQTAQAWMSADGTEMWLTWSGWPENDSVTFTKVDLTLGTPDSTPPSSPSNLSATAQSDTRIDLSWSPSQDPESGIAGYRVYRDGQPVVQTGPTPTSYSDMGLTESTSYEYAVTAVNGAGQESAPSGPVSETTDPDTTPPGIVSVAASGATSVTVVFDEAVEEASATALSSYSIAPGITIESAVLAPDLVTVVLTVSPMVSGTEYTLTVDGVRDRASTPNTIAPGTTVTFTYTSIVAVDIRISNSADDVEEDPAGTVTATSSDLELVEEGGTPQTVGLRFRSVQIPQGAVIVNATLQFATDETTSDSCNLLIEGEASDDAEVFGSVASRPRTSASVAWSPEPWEIAGEAGPAQRTGNLAAVIQQIVGRPGWSAGNALVLIISGSGSRVAEAYDGDSSLAPLLHLEYSFEAATDPPEPPEGLVVDSRGRPRPTR
jgi:hypothetical protein